MTVSPLRVVVVDDEMLARQVLKEHLLARGDIEIVAECANGFEAVKAITELQPELVLLDIQMPKLDGFEVLELVGRHVPVIFVTAYDEFAVRAFEIHAIDYLLKPFSGERVSEAIDRARTRLARAPETAGSGGAAGAGSGGAVGAAGAGGPSAPPVGPAAGGAAYATGTVSTQSPSSPSSQPQPATAASQPAAGRTAGPAQSAGFAGISPQQLRTEARPPSGPLERVLIRDGSRVHVIPVDDVDFVQAQDDYVCFHAGGKQYLKEQPLAEVEAALDAARFVRIHRSFLLNVDRLARVEPLTKDSRIAILKDGRRLPLSRAGYQRLNALL
jgi:DNA-binding LytR/AlgR family response regulator